MSDSFWFYCPGLAGAGVQVALPVSEAHHALRARRLKIGDTLTLFDGAGRVAEGCIADTSQRSTGVTVALGQHHVHPPPPAQIHLFSALPKGDRQGVMLDMATQLGMTDFTPLICERSVSQASNKAFERWQRTLIEACKQSHRPWLPVLHPPLAPRQLAARGATPECLVLLAMVGTAALARAFPGMDAVTASPRWLLVGPEGGFTPPEQADLKSLGSACVAVGTGVLRTETAAVAMVAVVAG